MAEYIHKYDDICPLGVIFNFAVDVLDESRGPVACVLMNVAEVTIFHHELLNSTQGFPADRIAVLANKLAIVDDPESFWADRDGKLWLMTYPQLSGILAASPPHLEEDLALLLHMGCGQYTWDIVKACHDLWKWGQNVEEGLGRPVVQVFTISNLEESIYRDVPTTYLSTSWTKGPRLERLEPDAFGPAIARVQQEFVAHVELCKSMKKSQEGDSDDEALRNVQEPQQLPKHTNRAVVFTSKDKLFDAYDRHNCPRKGYAEAIGAVTGYGLYEWVEVLLQRRKDSKTILVRPDVGTIGTVRNLGKVLVLPVREGLFFDRRVSQVVWRNDIPMSQAEVRYASRVACSPSGSAEGHAVSIFTTVAGFKELPPAPAGPPAFTGDFPAILLHFCEHSYFDGGDKTSPIRLPKDEEMTDEYLRRLELRGLTESHGGPLTDLGRLTSWWYHSCVLNFDVANLLAIASTAQGARASALMQIAAVIYHNESPLMSSIGSFLRFHVPEGRSAEFHRLIAERAEGFARSYVERGPIWIAVALRARQRESAKSQLDFSMCKDMLQVSPMSFGGIESNWAAMSQAWTNGLGYPQVDEDPQLNEEDFLFLEESIVRVWMHNLVLVNTSTSGLGVFASDLTSESTLARPPTNPVNWVRLAEEVDSEPSEGQPYTGVFAVYTALSRSKGPDGAVHYTPEDLTFVSTRAVRRVLRDVAISKRREGYPPPNWNDVLRTRYPICHDPGDS